MTSSPSAPTAEASLTLKTTRLERTFGWLWGSSGSATLADGIYQVALPIAALQLGSGAAAVAAVYTATRLPWVLFALHAGIIADRFDRRLLMVAANTMRTLSLLAGVLVVTRDMGGIAALTVVAFTLGIAETIGDTAMHSITPRVVSRANLERANSRMQATELVTNLFVGPSLGGMLAGIALGWAFGAVALLYVAAALSAVCIVQRPAPQPPPQGKTTVKDGLAFLFTRPRLAIYATGVGSLNISYGAFQTSLPVVALRPGALELTAGQYGVMLGSAGISGLVAGLLAPALVRQAGNRTCLLIGSLGLAAGLVTPGLTTNLPLVVAGMIGTGLLVLVNIVTLSYRQRAVPDHLLGRVTAAYRLLAFGGLPLGSALAGVLGAATSPQVVLVGAGILVVAAGIVMAAATPSFHHPAREDLQ
ncbi:MFS transporter [Streptomyces sp. NPDC004647]|uniref:MFS transporter n=1 Tax=Streptomyces sp. NPDC004647 TaxID=3154671 RepID=UPI0033A5BF55